MGVVMKRVKRKTRDWDAVIDHVVGWFVIVVFAALGVAAAYCLASAGEPSKAACPALESPRHAYLDKLAQGHAEYMARVQVQGHQGFDGRFHAARRGTGCRAVAEICAECWPWQSEATPAEQWAEYVKSWRQSPGHWSVARVKHRYVGIGSAKGRNGVWYGCLIAGD
jgi:hypothetical protein